MKISSILKNKAVLITVSAIALFLSFYVSDTIFYRESKRLDLHDYSSIKKRVYHKKDLNVSSSFDYNGKAFMIFSDNDFLYIIDKTNALISKYNSTGKEVNKIGKKGEAPWENNIISYVDFTKEHYFIFDSGSQMIKMFSKNNKLEKYVKTKSYILNITRLTGTNFLFPSFSNNDMQFNIIDLRDPSHEIVFSVKDNLEKAFGKYPKSNDDIIFSGYFARNNTGNVAYVFDHFGGFILFNSDGSVKGVYKTIDSTPLPIPVKIDRGGGITENTVKPDVIVNYSRCFFGDKLYILSNVLTSKNKNRVIDVYSSNDGQYIKSIELPTDKDFQKAIEIAGSNKLSVLYEDMRIVNFNVNKD